MTIAAVTGASAGLGAAFARRLAPSGMLWVSWPKKASGLVTDIGERDVMRIGLTAGLVDVKVCAVNEVWSGLKFVVRRALRHLAIPPDDPDRSLQMVEYHPSSAVVPAPTRGWGRRSQGSRRWRSCRGWRSSARAWR